MKLVHALIAIAVVAYVFVVCCVGCCAALCGFRRIDDFCARQLDDN